MPRRKVDHSQGGAEIERINELHSLLVDAAGKALENEVANGEIKAATLNVIRQLCADAGVQPSRQVAESMHSLNLALSKLNLQDMGNVLSR